MQGVYYLELRDTYFLWLRKKQTYMAGRTCFTPKSFLRLVFLKSVERLDAHRNICSTASYTQRLWPVVRSLAPSAPCSYRHVCTYTNTQNTDAHTQPPRTYSHCWNISGNTSNMTQGGSPRRKGRWGGVACHSSMSCTGASPGSFFYSLAHTHIRPVCVSMNPSNHSFL